MKTRCFNKSFLAFVVTAFLFLQWSATHIHLAGEHEHDGNAHQHAVTAHQHQLNSHHANAIDVASDPLSHTDSKKVVELDHDCTKLYGKHGDQYALLTPDAWDPFTRRCTPQPGVITHQHDRYQAYYQYTSLRLRAPPIIS